MKKCTGCGRQATQSVPPERTPQGERFAQYPYADPSDHRHHCIPFDSMKTAEGEVWMDFPDFGVVCDRCWANDLACGLFQPHDLATCPDPPEVCEAKTYLQPQDEDGTTDLDIAKALQNEEPWA